MRSDESTQATIVDRTVVGAALDAQGLFTGRAGENIEPALEEWLTKAGYPSSFRRVSVDQIALLDAAQPAAEVLYSIAAQADETDRFGGAAKPWPRRGVPAPSPAGKLGALSDTLYAPVSISRVNLGLAIFGAVAVGAAAGVAVSRAMR